MLTDEGRKFLRDMREHPNAPKFNYSCGDQLSQEGLKRLLSYEQELRAKQGWIHGEMPHWAFCGSTDP